MDDGETEYTATERMSATYSLIRTLKTTGATRPEAERMVNALKHRGLLDEGQLGRFVESLPSGSQPEKEPEPPKVQPPEQNDPLTLEQVLALRTAPPECAPTEFAAIDERVRGGGLPRGILACFTGPPESGKTRLLCQVGLGLSKTIPVVMLLTDWGRSAATDIMAVMEGFDPTKIDEDPRGAREWLDLKMAGRILFALDDGSPLAQAFDFADTLGPSAVLIDSLQSVSPAGIPGLEKLSAFEKNRAVTRYVRHRLRARGHTCIFTSESNRAFYAARAKEDRTTEISAPLGGGIDYAADLLLAIHRPEGEAEQRQIIFAKNRYRPYLNRLPRQITVDYLPDGRLAEISKEDAERAERSAYESSIVPVKRVLREILARGPQPSFRKFRDAVQNADASINDRLFAKVLGIMTATERSIVEGDGPRGATTYSLAYSDGD